MPQIDCVYKEKPTRFTCRANEYNYTSSSREVWHSEEKLIFGFSVKIKKNFLLSLFSNCSINKRGKRVIRETFNSIQPAFHRGLNASPHLPWLCRRCRGGCWGLETGCRVNHSLSPPPPHGRLRGRRGGGLGIWGVLIFIRN